MVGNDEKRDLLYEEEFVDGCGELFWSCKVEGRRKKSVKREKSGLESNSRSKC